MIKCFSTRTKSHMTLMSGQAPNIMKEWKVTKSVKCSALQNILQLSHNTRWCITMVIYETNKAHTCARPCWSIARRFINMPPIIHDTRNHNLDIFTAVFVMPSASKLQRLAVLFLSLHFHANAPILKLPFVTNRNAFINISNCPINILYRYTRYYLSILCHL